MQHHNIIKNAALSIFLLVAGVALLPSTANAQDVAIQHAIDRYSSGYSHSAMHLLADRLKKGGLAPRDELRGLIALANIFLSFGDTLSAEPIIQMAIRHEPCVMPSDTYAPPEWRDIYLRHRPAGISCGSERVSATFKSLILPGWGQRSLGLSSRGNWMLGLTVASAAASVGATIEANKHYDNYLAATSPYTAEDEYKLVKENRMYSHIAAGVAAGFWVFNVIDAFRMGTAEDNYIQYMGQYIVMPGITPDGAVNFGLRLNF